MVLQTIKDLLKLLKIYIFISSVSVGVILSLITMLIFSAIGSAEIGLICGLTEITIMSILTYKLLNKISIYQKKMDENLEEN